MKNILVHESKDYDEKVSFTINIVYCNILSLIIIYCCVNCLLITYAMAQVLKINILNIKEIKIKIKLIVVAICSNFIFFVF